MWRITCHRYSPRHVFTIYTPWRYCRGITEALQLHCIDIPFLLIFNSFLLIVRFTVTCSSQQLSLFIFISCSSRCNLNKYIVIYSLCYMQVVFYRHLLPWIFFAASYIYSVFLYVTPYLVSSIFCWFARMRVLFPCEFFCVFHKQQHHSGHVRLTSFCDVDHEDCYFFCNFCSIFVFIVTG